MTRRRGFWPGQSGHSVPPGFLGDDDGEQRAEPAVKWRAIDHPLHPGDVEHIRRRPTTSSRARVRPVVPVAPVDDFARPGGYGHVDSPDDRDAGYAHDDYDHGFGFDGFDGTDPTEPLDDGLPLDAGSVLRAVLVDRDDDRVEARGSRGRWRLGLAHRLEAAWPGQSDEGAPPGFPASGELVLHPPSTPSTPSKLVHLPVRRAPADDPDAIDGIEGIDGLEGIDGIDGLDVDAEAGVEVPAGLAGEGRFGGRRPTEPPVVERRGPLVPAVPLPSARSLQKVATAVYAALADPIVNADPEAREHRAAQVRRFGLLAGSAALAVVLIYAIFPVRTYLEQRSATQRARERIDKLSEANAELEQRKEQLSDDETVEEIARREYQLVFPGEESYGLLPPPVAPTTTTTTPGG
ncbi:MAG TPA: septum formation initiator family protein [Acidimicrobiales bacterium]|nr:septum formation initiator family protein [Acidimicrobiales bacterium]